MEQVIQIIGGVLLAGGAGVGGFKLYKSRLVTAPTTAVPGRNEAHKRLAWLAEYARQESDPEFIGCIQKAFECHTKLDEPTEGAA